MNIPSSSTVLQQKCPLDALVPCPAVCSVSDLAGEHISEQCNQAGLGSGDSESHFKHTELKALQWREMRHHENETSKAYK